MWKLAVILFIIVGPTLAGVGALVPLTIYGTNDFNPLQLIGAAVAGAVLAIPLSLLLAGRINNAMKPRGA